MKRQAKYHAERGVTMNPKAYACILAFICMALGFLTGCNNSSSASQGVSITATSGTPQNTTVGTAFLVPLRATVTANGGPASGVAVTFTAPATGASGTFANGTATETDMTNANGVATSSVFTANATVGGPYMVTASAPLASAPAGFSLTNTAAVTSNNYTFYLSGVAGVSGPGSTYYFYDLAGSVAIAADGTIVGGEQDFNQVNGYKSPQPSGDKITGGTLTVSATTGQGTLTLITNNTNLGVYGT